jgi:hypothetical protein
MKLIDDSRYARGIELLEAIVSMLTKMTCRTPTATTPKVAFTFTFTSKATATSTSTLNERHWR